MWSSFAAKTLSTYGYDPTELGRQEEVLALLEKAVRQGEEYEFILIGSLSDRTEDHRVEPLEVAKALASRFPGIPLIVASSKPTLYEAVIAYEIGASAYIAKTFDESQLLTLVKEAV